MNDDCARLGALAPCAALGALDRDEAAFVRAHVRACARGHPELADWFALAAAIGVARPRRSEPRAALRDRVLLAARLAG